jgi:hypothetical protein
MKNLLRRLTALVLALFLGGSIALADNEMAFIQGDLGEDVWFQSITLLGDTFYALFSDGGIYTWVPGQMDTPLYCKMTSLAGEEFYQFRLTAEDDRLYGFSGETGDIFLITSDGESKIATADLSVVPGDWSQYISPFVRDGSLYVLASLNEDYALVICDLATGKTRLQKAEGTQGMCLYKDGAALLMRGHGQQHTLSQMDLETGKTTDLPYELPEYRADWTEKTCVGLAYDEASDTIAYVYGGRLYISKEGQPFEGSLSLNHVWSGTETFLLKDGRYAYYYDGLRVADYEKAMGLEPLIVSMPDEGRSYSHALMNTSEAFWKFLEDYPDTPAVLTRENLTAADITQRITGGDKGVDVYALLVDSDTAAFKNKGFMADLSASAAITAAVNDLYPFAKALATDENGKVVCYPIDCQPHSWAYHPQIYASYFGDEPLPETYLELFEKMLVFEQDFASDNPQHAFIEWFDYETMIKQVVLSFARQYDVPDFLNPDLQKTLEKFAEVEAQRKINGEMNPLDYQTETEIVSYFGLFYSYDHQGYLTNTLSAYYANNPQTMLPLVFEKGETPNIPAYMAVLFVNPNSERKEAAYQFIQSATEPNDRFISLYYSLRESAVAPYEAGYRNIAGRLADYEAECERWRTALEKAAESEKRDIQEKLAEAEQALAKFEMERYEISAGGIENYQNALPFMKPTTDNQSFIALLSSLSARYAAGQLSLNAFLSELNRTAKLIENETK